MKELTIKISPEGYGRLMARSKTVGYGDDPGKMIEDLVSTPEGYPVLGLVSAFEALREKLNAAQSKCESQRQNIHGLEYRLSQNGFELTTLRRELAKLKALQAYDKENPRTNEAAYKVAISNWKDRVSSLEEENRKLHDWARDELRLAQDRYGIAQKELHEYGAVLDQFGKVSLDGDDFGFAVEALRRCREDRDEQ